MLTWVEEEKKKHNKTTTASSDIDARTPRSLPKSISWLQNGFVDVEIGLKVKLVLCVCVKKRKTMLVIVISHATYTIHAHHADGDTDASDVSLKVTSFMEHKMETRVEAAEILLHYTFDNRERGVKHTHALLHLLLIVFHFHLSPHHFDESFSVLMSFWLCYAMLCDVPCALHHTC